MSRESTRGSAKALSFDERNMQLRSRTVSRKLYVARKTALYFFADNFRLISGLIICRRYVPFRVSTISRDIAGNFKRCRLRNVMREREGAPDFTVKILQNKRRKIVSPRTTRISFLFIFHLLLFGSRRLPPTEANVLRECFRPSLRVNNP